MSQASDPLLGSVIDGRFEILERLGSGGMGVVYKARQPSLDRLVALKMLNPQLARDPTWVQRFYDEARLCSQLQHPNTIRMFDFGQTRNGQLFMTMELLAGQSVRQAIDRHAPMAPQRVLAVLIQCCASLAEAHAVGIVHRDLKPDNVFLLELPGAPELVKVLDFSIAKLVEQAELVRTQQGQVVGTPQYMSPEHGRGGPLDPRSDLYSLGILAYEMLTGRVPFDASNPLHVVQMHLRHAVPPLPASVPPAIAAMVLRALAKDPAHRHQSAGEMMAHCQELAAQLHERPRESSAIAAAPHDKTLLAHQAPDAAAIRAAAAQMTLRPNAAQPAAPQKTMMLQDTEGIVSLAQRGQTAPPVSAPVALTAEPPSARFWAICLITGLMTGIFAYLLVVSLTG